MTIAERSAAAFVDVWANEVRRLVPEVRELRDRHERDMWAAERLEDWSPTDLDLYEGFCRLWATQHQLVWSAHQLERWAERVARERGETAPARDAVLANLRNALEHLNEAEFDEEGVAGAGSDPKANRSLRRLPDARLQIGTGSGPLLFELVDPAELERRALAVVTTTDLLMQEAEDWVAEYGWPSDPDEPRDDP